MREKVPLSTGLDILALCILTDAGVLADGQDPVQVARELLSVERLAPEDPEDKGREWWRPLFSASPNTGEGFCPVLIGDPGIGKTSQTSYLLRVLLREAYRGLPVAVKVIPGALFRQGTVAGIEGLNHAHKRVESYTASLVAKVEELARANVRVVLFLDEIDLIPQQLQCYLQQFISRGEAIHLPDRVSLCGARNVTGQNAEDDLPEATRSRMVEIPVSGGLKTGDFVFESPDTPARYLGRAVAGAVEPTLNRIVRPYVHFVKKEHREAAYEAARITVEAALEQAYGAEATGVSRRVVNRVSNILQTAYALSMAVPASAEYAEAKSTAMELATRIVPKLVLGETSELAAVLARPVPDPRLFLADPCGFVARNPRDTAEKTVSALIALAENNGEIKAELPRVATALVKGGEAFEAYATLMVVAATKAGLDVDWPDMVVAVTHPTPDQ